MMDVVSDGSTSQIFRWGNRNFHVTLEDLDTRFTYAAAAVADSVWGEAVPPKMVKDYSLTLRSEGGKFKLSTGIQSFVQNCIREQKNWVTEIKNGLMEIDCFPADFLDLSESQLKRLKFLVGERIENRLHLYRHVGDFVGYERLWAGVALTQAMKPVIGTARWEQHVDGWHNSVGGLDRVTLNALKTDPVSLLANQLSRFIEDGLLEFDSTGLWHQTNCGTTAHYPAADMTYFLGTHPIVPDIPQSWANEVIKSIHWKNI